MSDGSCVSPEMRLCGCCEGLGPETPEPVANRPGLSAIAYRVGRHPTFTASMLAALSDPDFAALGALRTRDDTDFSIALLDAWATASDILTFYQERIANESYLRTAVDGRSVTELARLVGYKPSPGVAASAVLAFTLSTAPGSPDRATIPAGSRVQSVPGPGESPRVFETASDLVALAEYNAVPAQASLPWALAGADTSTWIKGTANAINAGDALLFIDAPSGQPSTGGPADLRFVTSMTPDPASGNTRIAWNRPLSPWSASAGPNAAIYVFRKKAALFGVQAPNPNVLAQADKIPPGPTADGSDWDFAKTYGDDGVVHLDASYPGLEPASTSDPSAMQWLVLAGPEYASYFLIQSASESNPNLYAVSAKTTQLTLSTVHVLAGDPYLDLNEILYLFTKETRVTTAYVRSGLLTPAGLPYLSWAYDGTYARQAGVLRPVEGSSLEIVGGQQLPEGQPVAVNGKRLRLRVSAGAQAAFVPRGASAPLAVGDGDVFIADAFPPSPGSPQVTGGEMWQAITGSGIAGTLHAAPSNLTLLPAVQSDPVTGETVVIGATSVSGAVTALAFTRALSRIYDRATVTINANAVEATDGETTHEILGSGDATNPALRFTLKQTPLTYTGTPSGLGAQSTLQVWVNNLRWHEVDDFLQSGPADRVFVTRADDRGAVTVQFGDGIAGGRTPTGQVNLRATYRKGIGAAGNVRAGQLSQPLDRPQGLAGAVNPSPASGGADPDPPDAVRTSAPLHVLTLDRVVSLGDYQNYARAFAGIAKALATWTWFGRTRGVFLTVAGAGGAGFRPADSTIANLAQALRGAGNPYVPLVIISYVPVLFEVGAAVRVDAENYDPPQVLAAVWQALAGAFAFEQRDLGQGVAQGEVIAVMQGVPGVIAVEMTQFARQGQPSAPGGLPAVLRAAAPVAGGEGAVQAAEMLLLDPASQGSIGVWS